MQIFEYLAHDLKKFMDFEAKKHTPLRRDLVKVGVGERQDASNELLSTICIILQFLAMHWLLVS